MIQVCDPPRQRPVRRFSAEEFCWLARGEAGSLYRPRSEVLRMLTVGEVCGVCDGQGVPAGAVLLQPLNADTTLAAALRAFAGWRGIAGGQFLTPPVLRQPDAAETLLCAALTRAERLARGGPVLAVLECTAQADELIPLYIGQGLALRALRPLNSLAPCFVLSTGCAAKSREPVWVPLEDRARLAFLLARGYAALDSRPCPAGQGAELAMTLV